MPIDIIQHLNDNVDLTAGEKASLLDDFCAQYSYQELDEEGNPNPVSKKDFANDKIKTYIKDSVNARRITVAKAAAAYTELELEDA
jgi:hypothetical protein